MTSDSGVSDIPTQLRNIYLRLYRVSSGYVCIVSIISHFAIPAHCRESADMQFIEGIGPSLRSVMVFHSGLHLKTMNKEISTFFQSLREALLCLFGLVGCSSLRSAWKKETQTLSDNPLGNLFAACWRRVGPDTKPALPRRRAALFTSTK